VIQLREPSSVTGLAVLDGEATERARRLQSPLSVSVVIPTLNEARNLSYVFDRLPDGLHEVIIVDGNSSDGTIEVARNLRPDVRIVNQTALGKGNALACGFAACTGDIIVMLDADGSTDPGELARFVEPLLEGAEFVKGSRFLPGGGSSDITPIRRIGNKVLCAVVNILFGTKYTDLCYGYNAFLAHCLDDLIVDCPGFEVETLMNIRAAKLSFKVAEVASFEANRIHGTSNLHPIRDGLRVLRVVARERFSRRGPQFDRAVVLSHPFELDLPQVEAG
jgi:glycosyltransferase involved in cell wall biosynthesis